MTCPTAWLNPLPLPTPDSTGLPAVEAVYCGTAGGSTVVDALELYRPRVLVMPVVADGPIPELTDWQVTTRDGKVLVWEPARRLGRAAAWVRA